MRIAVAGFQHETNRFSPIPTTLADFVRQDGWPGLAQGAQIFDVFPGMNIPLSGFINYGREHFDIVPVLWASAEPGGLIEDDAFEEICALILNKIKQTPALDGIYLDLHGAMVTQSHDDAEGVLLRRLRNLAGPTIPVVASLDLHANITHEMFACTNLLTVFRTYPHLDMAATGRRAGRLIHELLETKAEVFGAFGQIPLLVPLQSQCTDFEPVKSLYAMLPQDLSLRSGHQEIAMGFPASDIYDCGPAVVAYSSDPQDGPRQTNAAANQIKNAFRETQDQFQMPLYRPDEAAQKVANKPLRSKLTLLADVQDNCGAGATSDTTELLQALVRHGIKNCVVAALCDKEIVAAAHRAGLGGVIEGSLGGKISPDQNPAFAGKFKVIALSDGVFEFTGEMMRGGIANIGPTAAVEILDTQSDICVVVTSQRIQCLDQAIVSHLGIDCAAKSVLALKSSVHFRADFEALADEIILVEAFGFNPCRFTADLFSRLRSDMTLL